METANPDELYEVPIHLAEDPYFPQDCLVAPSDLSEEEDPSEDEEDDDVEEVVESGDVGILQDV